MFDKALTLLFVLTCTASSALAAEAVPTQPAPAYRLTKAIALGAPDRWDALTFDPSSGRLYISHGDRVTVVDGRSGAILGEVDGFPGGTMTSPSSPMKAAATPTTARREWPRPSI